MQCLFCKNDVARANAKYCSNKCQMEYQYTKYILDWQNGVRIGNRGHNDISSYVERYIKEKFNYKCAICGWNSINPYTNKIPLEIEHIDGNPYNHSEDNLLLLCPNCHSLTSTYKGANIGNGRKGRKNFYL